jgi:hypothetical protein
VRNVRTLFFIPAPVLDERVWARTQREPVPASRLIREFPLIAQYPGDGGAVVLVEIDMLPNTPSV